jgi:hypothetical protein
MSSSSEPIIIIDDDDDNNNNTMKEVEEKTSPSSSKSTPTKITPSSSSTRPSRAAAAAAASKMVVDISSSDDEDEDDDDDEEATSSSKKKKKQSSTTKTNNKNSSNSSSSSKKKKLKLASTSSESDDDDDDEDELEEEESEPENNVDEDNESSPKKKKKSSSTNNKKSSSNSSNNSSNLPPSKRTKTSKSTTSNNKKHQVEFIDTEGQEGDAPKLTKKAQKEREKAKRLAEQKIVVFSGDPSNPLRELSGDDERVRKYASLTLDRLKDFLRCNGMLIKGTKDELVERCVDGEINGRLTKCTRCKHGRLTFKPDTGKFSCSGYYDKDVSMFIKCPFMGETAPREKWLDPAVDAPVGGNDESGEGQDSSSAGGGSAVVVNVEEILTPEFTTSIASLDVRELATAVTKRMKDLGYTLPSDENKSRVEFGQTYMKEGKDLTKTILAVGTKFPKPLVEGSEAATAAAAAAASQVARVEANESLAQLFDDIAKYEKILGGDVFKIRSHKSVAVTLRDLSYEVTSGKALAKPGPNKVSGIGKGSAQIIDEFLESGKTSSPLLEELKAKVEG